MMADTVPGNGFRTLFPKYEGDCDLVMEMQENDLDSWCREKRISRRFYEFATGTFLERGFFLRFPEGVKCIEFKNQFKSAGFTFAFYSADVTLWQNNSILLDGTIQAPKPMFKNVNIDEVSWELGIRNCGLATHVLNSRMFIDFTYQTEDDMYGVYRWQNIFGAIDKTCIQRMCIW